MDDGESALRERRRGAWLPPLAGALTWVTGVVNAVSAVTSGLHERANLLLHVVPEEVLIAAHVLALPGGLALIALSGRLRRRRRRALWLAVGLLGVVGLLDIVKGLDVEEALLSWSLAGLLVWGRTAFCATLPQRTAGPDDHDATVADVARRLVHAHGSDTLAAFTLRGDVHRFFGSDRRAFLAYRIEGGVLLVAGDPVGPPDSVSAVVRELCAFAELRGLHIGVVGASDDGVELWGRAGLRSMYVGDEAIIDTGSFSLTGRPIRKVRQSVHRLQRAGYTLELRAAAGLEPAELARLETVSDSWRDGADERGFSMTLDSLGGAGGRDALVALARDDRGEIRAFLQIVTAYGRPAMSLSMMRRERDTPNGLMEFMVVETVRLLRERGVEELSLNFAAFARWLYAPANLRERVLGRIVALGNPWFQIESLYAFNAKFFPRWQPRYLLFERPSGLPRTSVAALWAEGQLWRPSLGRP
jgi:lysyl-tRNA synthetase class 2